MLAEIQNIVFCLSINIMVFSGINNYIYFPFFLSNLQKIKLQILTGEVDNGLIPTLDFLHPSSVTLKDYNTWFNENGNSFPGNLTACDLEKELQKVFSVLLL